MKYEVSIARCGSYDGALVHDAIGKCLAPLGGMDAFVHPGDRVLIKLNLLSAQPPECAVTTHPSVVRAAVDLVQECGGHPVIGDSPGGKNTGRSYRRLLRKTGIQQVIDETGCESVFFDADVIEIFSETPPYVPQVPGSPDPH